MTKHGLRKIISFGFRLGHAPRIPNMLSCHSPNPPSQRGRERLFKKGRNGGDGKVLLEMGGRL